MRVFPAVRLMGRKSDRKVDAAERSTAIWHNIRTQAYE
jgi:hypothetical protein